MHDNFKILNTKLTKHKQVYRLAKSAVADSQLPDSLLSNIAQLIGEHTDSLRLFSSELEQACSTDELRKAIFAPHYNYIRALNLDHVDKVLDLSDDFGAIADYLSDKVGSIECVKADTGIAQLAQLRCQARANVCIIAANIDQLTLPPQHYDLIILGNIDHFSADADSLKPLLPYLRAALSEQGCLVINTLNQQRPASLFDAQSLDVNNTIPYADLYSTIEHGHQLAPLHAQLTSAGYSAVQTHASFGKNHACSNLFSEDYLNTNQHALNHFYRLGFIQNPAINEYLLIKTKTHQHHALHEMATRFTFIASGSSEANQQLADKDFIYFPSNQRKPHWRAITQRVRSNTTVIKQPILALTENTSDEQSLVSQNLAPQNFVDGKILVDDWLQAVLEQDHQQFTALVQEYNDWLIKRAQSDDFTQTAFDLLPFNILINNHKGKRQFGEIDTEWQINYPFDANFVLFRALFWFAFENKAFLHSFAERMNASTIGKFVLHFMPNADTLADLQAYIELEERIHSEINQHHHNTSINNILRQQWTGEPHSTYMQVFWGNQKHQFDQANARGLDWQSLDDPQDFTVLLPPTDPSNTLLRIDPVARRGAFRFNSLELFDQQDNSLWRLNNAAQIQQHASVENAQFCESLFIALNDDPYFLFDLKKTNISPTQVAKLTLQLEWVWDESYSSVVNTLSQRISDLNTALFELKSPLLRRISRRIKHYF